MMEAIRSAKTPFFTRATRCNISEDAILHLTHYFGCRLFNLLQMQIIDCAELELYTPATLGVQSSKEIISGGGGGLQELFLRLTEKVDLK
jgi:hypothetical protein